MSKDNLCEIQKLFKDNFHEFEQGQKTKSAKNKSARSAYAREAVWSKFIRNTVKDHLTCEVWVVLCLLL